MGYQWGAFVGFAMAGGALAGGAPGEVVEATSTIACKDRQSCEQMAADLDALVDAIGMPRSAS
jgi:hypothetical protein